MEAFATVEDYETRYGEVSDEQRLAVLLDDASAFIASLPGFETRDDDPVFTANLTRVTCAVVNRAMLAGDMAGIQSYSETAVGISASVTPYNPSGDFYLTKAEKAALGITGSRIGTIPPVICGYYGCNSGDDDADA